MTSSRPGPTTTATLTPPPPGGGTCRANQLRVTSAIGGASQGREYAAVVFTNTSAATCTMRGYPAAQLVRNGNLLGNPAAHDTTTTVRTQTVRPNASVQAVLSAVSTCQSPLSDHVRVIAPGQTAPLDTAIQLRACGLTIGPVDLP